MQNSAKGSIFRFAVAAALISGIFPSFVALSEGYAREWPGLSRFTGPLNPLKWFLPALLVWVIYAFRVRADSTERKTLLGVLGFWCVGTFFSAIAAFRCGFAPAFLREWAALSVGLLVGVALPAFDSRTRDRVFAGWFGIVLAAVFLDAFFPTIVDFLYARVFDPHTRDRDVREVGFPVLTGIFGRQSLAKFMAWLPWLVLPTFARRWERFWVPGFFAIVVFGGTILATSQRGPTLAAFAAATVFLLHRGWRTSDRRWFAAIPAALALFALSIVVFVPKEIVAPRVLDRAPPTTAAPEKVPANQVLVTARDNASFRKKVLVASGAWIASHPLGSACIPDEFFVARDLIPAHAHNLFIEQFRSRGWIWGILHLLAWLAAGIGFLRGTDVRASAFLAAWTAIQVSGLFDHPWFVINQAIVLGAVLVAGIDAFLRAYSGRAADEALPGKSAG